MDKNKQKQIISLIRDYVGDTLKDKQRLDTIDDKLKDIEDSVNELMTEKEHLLYERKQLTTTYNVDKVTRFTFFDRLDEILELNQDET